MVDFLLDFPVVLTVSIIMIRLSYIIESCQSFQTVLFSGLRNISLQVLRGVGRVWNEGSRMLCQRLLSPSTTTRRLVLQNFPSLGLPALIRPSAIWRVLNKLRCERYQTMKPCNGLQHFLKYFLIFTLIIETLKPVQSWLC